MNVEDTVYPSVGFHPATVQLGNISSWGESLFAFRSVDKQFLIRSSF